MALLFTAQTLVFVEENVPENDCCVIPRHLWSQWTREQTDDVMLVKVTYNEKDVLLHVYSHSDERNTIYIPRWCFGNEFPMNVTMERVIEMPPIATKIILQPLDSEIYHCDIATAVSEHLSNWHVLSEGTTLTVPCAELGGFLVDIFVRSIEPAPTVLLRGEVPLELGEPLETVAEWNLPPPLPPQRPDTPRPESPSMFSEPLAPNKKGFIAFSGAGNRLGN
jgi:hypothetical protein